MQISNVTFDEIAIGDTATYTRLITNQEVEAFAAISGDHNPLHLDPEYAATTAFGKRRAADGHADIHTVTGAIVQSIGSTFAGSIKCSNTNPDGGPEF